MFEKLFCGIVFFALVHLFVAGISEVRLSELAVVCAWFIWWRGKGTRIRDGVSCLIDHILCLMGHYQMQGLWHKLLKIFRNQ